jgi:hypothetical protein
MCFYTSILICIRFFICVISDKNIVNCYASSDVSDIQIKTTKHVMFSESNVIHETPTLYKEGKRSIKLIRENVRIQKTQRLNEIGYTM